MVRATLFLCIIIIDIINGVKIEFVAKEGPLADVHLAEKAQPAKACNRKKKKVPGHERPPKINLHDRGPNPPPPPILHQNLAPQKAQHRHEHPILVLHIPNPRQRDQGERGEHICECVEAGLRLTEGAGNSGAVSYDGAGGAAFAIGKLQGYSE